MLSELARRTTIVGDIVEVETKLHFPSFYCSKSREFAFFLKAVQDRGWIEIVGALRTGRHSIRVLADGWEVLEQIGPERGNRAFVAMPFSEDYADLWHEGIRPAIETAGFDPYRVCALDLACQLRRSR